jgi:NAD(P)-dependent dehydrogenase (short-subunit alcohol dehydrogenase family)
MGWFEERAGLDGTVAVVSGGAGGLGEGIVLDLAANGVQVALIDKDADALAGIERALAEGGHDAIVHLGDARQPEALAALFDAADERWGRLDILVNVVGGTFRAPFADTTPKAWDALIRANLLHVLHATSMAIPRMRAGGRGGSIVNITTIEAHRAAPGFAVYSAAKAAVTQFARTLAVEVAADGIRVNNVAPDITPTPNMSKMSGGVAPLGSPAGVRIAIPMGRVGDITDVSGCVVFLASRLSSYVTGTTLHPDGGTWASAGWFNWPGAGFVNAVPPDVLERIGDA